MKKTLSMLAVTVALVASPLVSASSTNAPEQSPLQTVIASLELTESQTTDIFSMIDDYQQNRPTIDINKAIELKKEQLRLITQPTMDEEAMEAIFDKAHAKEKELLMEEMRLKNSIYNVLTEKQKEQFKTSMKSLLMGE